MDSCVDLHVAEWSGLTSGYIVCFTSGDVQHLTKQLNKRKWVNTWIDRVTEQVDMLCALQVQTWST